MKRVNIALAAVLALLCFAAAAEASAFGRLGRKLMAYACTVNACAGATSSNGVVSAFSNAQYAGLTPDRYVCVVSAMDARCPGNGINTASSMGRK